MGAGQPRMERVHEALAQRLKIRCGVVAVKAHAPRMPGRRGHLQWTLSLNHVRPAGVTNFLFKWKLDKGLELVRVSLDQRHGGLVLVAQVQRQQAAVNAGFGFDAGQRESVRCGGAHGALAFCCAAMKASIWRASQTVVPPANLNGFGKLFLSSLAQRQTVDRLMGSRPGLFWVLAICVAR